MLIYSSWLKIWDSPRAGVSSQIRSLRLNAHASPCGIYFAVVVEQCEHVFHSQFRCLKCGLWNFPSLSVLCACTERKKYGFENGTSGMAELETAVSRIAHEFAPE